MDTTGFCELYRRHASTIDLSMRQTHKAGENVFLDDSGLTTLTGGDQPRDLLEILEDRHGRKSTLITSWLPVDHRPQ